MYRGQCDTNPGMPQQAGDGLVTTDGRQGSKGPMRRRVAPSTVTGMATPLSETRSAQATQKRLVCIGCMDSKHCWVCEGTGHASPHAGHGVCVKCEGRGLCTYCPVVPDPRSAH